MNVNVNFCHMSKAVPTVCLIKALSLAMICSFKEYKGAKQIAAIIRTFTQKRRCVSLVTNSSFLPI